MNEKYLKINYCVHKRMKDLGPFLALKYAS